MALAIITMNTKEKEEKRAEKQFLDKSYYKSHTESLNHVRTRFIRQRSFFFVALIQIPIHIYRVVDCHCAIQF